MRWREPRPLPVGESPSERFERRLALRKRLPRVVRSLIMEPSSAYVYDYRATKRLLRRVLDMTGRRKKFTKAFAVYAVCFLACANAREPTLQYTYLDGQKILLERHPSDPALFRLKEKPDRYMRLTGRILTEFPERPSDADIAGVAQRFSVAVVRRLPAGSFVVFSAEPVDFALAAASRMHESGEFKSASAEWLPSHTR